MPPPQFEEMHMLKKIAVLFIAILLMGATFADPPRNVRMRFAPQQTSLDSLTFDLRWNAPQPSRGATPIEGYEWEFLRSKVGASVPDSLLTSGTTAENERLALIDTPVICGDSIYYKARVRAIGSWDTAAPWGESNVVDFYCANLPPGPPVVTLDTIPSGGGG
jgi:hypothetical protein